jgi:galactose-6-phosphate isomerase
MPDLDVTEIIEDPDFATTFSVTTAVETVNSHGLAVQAPVSTIDGVIGVVYPANDMLQRTVDGSRLNSSICIVTKYFLNDGRNSPNTADLINWNGRDYTIRSVSDYSQYGQGFVQAIGDLYEMN